MPLMSKTPQIVLLKLNSSASRKFGGKPKSSAGNGTIDVSVGDATDKLNVY